MAKFNLTATVNTSLAGTTLAGEQGFTVGVLNGVGATGPQGLTGAGFTGGSYDSSTGIVTFTSDDGLGFSTGDLRGADGTGTGSGSVTSVGTGGGLTGGPITSSGTISHADTSTQSDITATSNTYVDGLTFDDYGHVTGVTTVAGFDGDYSSLTNTPTLFDGDYNSLTNQPSLFDGDYNSLTNQPTLGTAAAAATTDFATAAQGATADTALQPNAAADFGSNEIKYSNVYATTGDLPNASTYHGMFAHVHATGKGYFAHAGNWVELANASDIFDGDYTSLTNVPATFAPSAHTHTISEVTNLQTSLDAKQDASSAFDGDYGSLSNVPTTFTPSAHTLSSHSDVSTASPTDGQVLAWNNTGSTWEPQTVSGGGVPSGTTMLFQQTAAPTGWTKQTTHDNKALRVVSGTASSGGSDSFTTVFGTGKTTENHTLTIAQMPSHSHTADMYYNNNASGWSAYPNGDAPSVFAGTFTVINNTGGGQAHSHNLANFDLQYVDVIVATKD